MFRNNVLEQKSNVPNIYFIPKIIHIKTSKIQYSMKNKKEKGKRKREARQREAGGGVSGGRPVGRRQWRCLGLTRRKIKLRLLDEDVRTNLVEIVHSTAMYMNPVVFSDEG
jgi:hypothetical protein